MRIKSGDNLPGFQVRNVTAIHTQCASCGVKIVMVHAIGPQATKNDSLTTTHIGKDVIVNRIISSTSQIAGIGVRKCIVNAHTIMINAGLLSIVQSNSHCSRACFGQAHHVVKYHGSFSGRWIDVGKMHSVFTGRKIDGIAAGMEGVIICI